MILQAADYAEGKQPIPPYELQIAQITEAMGAPWSGGWMNWPAGLPSRVMTAEAYARAFRLYRANASQKGWVDANQHIFRLVTKVWQIRKDAGYSVWW